MKILFFSVTKIPDKRYTDIANHTANNTYLYKMNIYIVRSYGDAIVITKFAITKFATRRTSKAQSIVMY